jgi:hypothetical protein
MCACTYLISSSITLALVVRISACASSAICLRVSITTAALIARSIAKTLVSKYSNETCAFSSKNIFYTYGQIPASSSNLSFKNESLFELQQYATTVTPSGLGKYPLELLL